LIFPQREMPRRSWTFIKVWTSALVELQFVRESSLIGTMPAEDVADCCLYLVALNMLELDSWN
jgi:hypothetical protein